jgi:hypothetical protein
MREIVESCAILLLIAFLSLGCPPPSLACTGEAGLPEGPLRVALQAVLEARSSITRVDDDPGATGYKSYIERGLKRTFDKLSGAHTCSIYKSGENKFSVHVFAFAKGPERDALVQQIEQRKLRTLQIEQPMIYTFIPTDTVLVFLVADRMSSEEFRPMFEEVKERAGAR